MKKTLTILVATTALSTAIGIPAWSAIQAPEGEGHRPLAALFEGDSQTLPLVLASDDDDRRWWKGARRGHDDDDDEYEDDDDDEDDDDRGGARNPAPVGTVAPPQNGLFGNGAPPQVKTK
jgi:hypothetical protein